MRHGLADQFYLLLISAERLLILDTEILRLHLLPISMGHISVVHIHMVLPHLQEAVA